MFDRRSTAYSRLPPGFIGRSSIAVVGGGLVIFGLREAYRGNERLNKEFLLPLAHGLLEPETCHRAAVSLAKYGLGFARSKLQPEAEAVLRTKVAAWGVEFASPFGLAAGFDKDADAVRNLRLGSGFSLVEAGTVTPLPQPGNPRPRLFLLEDQAALINRYGFNSGGHGLVLGRMKAEWERGKADGDGGVWLGINLGKNKDADDAKRDYEIGVALIGPYADYIVINVSSPNTPGLRALQSKKELKGLLRTARDARARISSRAESPPKLLLKIAPDLVEAELRDIADLALDKANGVDGLIVTNTTISRAGVSSTEAGGLSGPPLREASTRVVRSIYALTKGSVPIVGCGGVSSGTDAYEKIRAGASLVQVYTALVYQGFPLVGRLKRELAECLIRDGFASVADAVGADHRK